MKKKKPAPTAKRIEALNKEIAFCHRKRRETCNPVLFAERIRIANKGLRRLRS